MYLVFVFLKGQYRSKYGSKSVISTSIHRCVNNSPDIKVLTKVIGTETFNVGFTSQQIHFFRLFSFSAFFKRSDLDPYLLSYIFFVSLHIYIYIYIYIYILSSTDRSVSFYLNSSVWLDRLDSRSWDRNPVDSNANPGFSHAASRKLAQAKKI